MKTPTRAGLWNFVGNLNYGNGPASQLIREQVRVYWGGISQEWQASSAHGYHPVRHLVGEWQIVPD